MNNEKSIDLSMLSGLLYLQEEGEPDVVEEMMSVFLSDAPSLVSDIRNAVERSDAESLSMAAHRFKSSSFQMGAARMGELCLQLENKGEEGELSGTKELFVELEQEFEVFQKIVATKPWKELTEQS